MSFTVVPARLRAVVGVASRTFGTAVLLIAFAAAAQTLTLEEARQLAEANQPMLDAQRAAIAAARDDAVAVRQLPDPKLRLGILNVPADGPDSFTLGQDFMTMRMVGVMQEFPRKDKRELRGRLLDLSGEKNALELDFLRRQIRRDVTLAWLESAFAGRALALIRNQQREASAQVDSANILIRSGRGSAADAAAARVELELLKDREREVTGSEQSTRVALARWIGERANAPLPSDALAQADPPPLAELLSHVAGHPHLAAFDKQAQIAQTDAELARLATKPDWSIEVSYAQRGPAFSNMLSVQFGIDLPIFQTNRQDRSTAAKFSAADEARSRRDDNLREMRAEASRLYSVWQTANDRLNIFRDQVLPQGRLRLDAATAAYRGGKSSLDAVLMARRALLELELDALRREFDRAKAGAEIEYFAHSDGARQ